MVLHFDIFLLRLSCFSKGRGWGLRVDDFLWRIHMVMYEHTLLWRKKKSAVTIASLQLLLRWTETGPLYYFVIFRFLQNKVLFWLTSEEQRENTKSPVFCLLFVCSFIHLIFFPVSSFPFTHNAYTELRFHLDTPTFPQRQESGREGEDGLAITAARAPFLISISPNSSLSRFLLAAAFSPVACSLRRCLRRLPQRARVLWRRLALFVVSCGVSCGWRSSPRLTLPLRVVFVCWWRVCWAASAWLSLSCACGGLGG